MNPDVSLLSGSLQIFRCCPICFRVCYAGFLDVVDSTGDAGTLTPLVVVESVQHMTLLMYSMQSCVLGTSFAELADPYWLWLSTFQLSASRQPTVGHLTVDLQKYLFVGGNVFIGAAVTSLLSLAGASQ
ncbi:unnamed protein product [Caenorhabditis brenneri]